MRGNIEVEGQIKIRNISVSDWIANFLAKFDVAEILNVADLTDGTLLPKLNQVHVTFDRKSIEV